MQQKMNYSLIKYFECIGVIVSIIELTANELSGGEVARVKCLNNVELPKAARRIKGTIQPIRNQLVHDSINFSRLLTLYKDERFSVDAFTVALKAYSDILGFIITYEDIYERVNYIVSFVYFINNMAKELFNKE